MNRVYAGFIIGLSLFSGLKEAQALTDVELEMLKAQDFVEAGDGNAAREIYSLLSARESDRWKKSLLAYDIATTYLLSGDWQEALKHYDAVELGSSPFPLLLYRLKSNMAIAHWRLAQKDIEELKKQTAYYEEEYFNIFFLLKKTLINIDEAERANCTLMEVEGDPYCVPQGALEKLRLAVEQRRALLFEEYSKDKIARLSIKEALPLMISGLTSWKEALADLKGLAMDRNIEEEQIHRILKQVASWNPLWEAILQKVESELTEEKKERFDQALQAYYKGQEALKDGASDKSASALENARKALNDLFFVLLEEDPIQDIFRKVLGEYDRAVASTEVLEEVIRSLIDQQKTIKELLLRRKLPIDKLDESEQYLNEALKYAEAAQNGWARIYLLLSYQLIERLSWSFETEKGLTAERVIEYAISEQTTALILNNLRFDALDGPNENALKFVQNSQKETLNAADQLWAKVIKVQREGYQKEGTDDRNENALRCQFQPWSSVMPLYEKGYQEANVALEVLMNQGQNRVSKDHQQAALNHWKEALDKLKSTPPQESCESPPSSGGGGAPPPTQENKEENKAEPAEIPEPQKTSTQEILRLLQQMDQDDRQRGPEKSTAEFTEKSW